MFHEHHSRSLFKATTWFILAFIVTFTTLLIITKNWKTSLLEASTLQALKAIVYYFHERIWNKSSYGQKLKKPAIVMK